MSKKQPKRRDRAGVDRYGRTPLHYAAESGNKELVGDLLAFGADPGASDHDGWTPLQFAAQRYSAAAAAALLDAGADTDPRDLHRNTPLFTAVLNSRGEGSVIQLLRSRGADPLAVNVYGQTPAGLARLIANYDTARFFSDVPEPAARRGAAADQGVRQ